MASANECVMTNPAVDRNLGPADLSDNRPWLLFDLRFLVQAKYEKDQRQRQQQEAQQQCQRRFQSRHGITSCLLQLRAKFRLGIFTTEERRTVETALLGIVNEIQVQLKRGKQDQLRQLQHESAAYALFANDVTIGGPSCHGGGSGPKPTCGESDSNLAAATSPTGGIASIEGPDMDPAPDCHAVPARSRADGAGCRSRGSSIDGHPPSGRDSPIDARVFFSCILHRDNCVPDPNWKQKRHGKGGQPGMIKSLAGNNLPLERCLLLDTGTESSAPGEQANLMVMSAKTKFRVWQKLISLLMALPAGPDVDIRNHIPTISQRVAQVSGKKGDAAPRVLGAAKATVVPLPLAPEPPQHVSAAKLQALERILTGVLHQEKAVEKTLASEAAVEPASAAVGNNNGLASRVRQSFWVAAAETAAVEKFAAETAARRKVSANLVTAAYGNVPHVVVLGALDDAQQISIIRLLAQQMAAESGVKPSATKPLSPLQRQVVQQLQLQHKTKADPRIDTLIVSCSLAASFAVHGSVSYEQVLRPLTKEAGRMMAKEARIRLLRLAERLGLVRCSPPPCRYMDARFSVDPVLDPESVAAAALWHGRQAPKASSPPPHDGKKEEAVAGVAEADEGGAGSGSGNAPMDVAAVQTAGTSLPYSQLPLLLELRKRVWDQQHLDGADISEIIAIAKGLVSEPLRPLLTSLSMTRALQSLVTRGVLGKWTIPINGDRPIVKFYVRALPKEEHLREALEALELEILGGVDEPRQETRCPTAEHQKEFSKYSGSGSAEEQQRRRREEMEEEWAREQRQREWEQEQEEKERAQQGGECLPPTPTPLPTPLLTKLPTTADMTDSASAGAAALGGSESRKRVWINMAVAATAGGPRSSTLPGATPFYGRPWIWPTVNRSLIKPRPAHKACGLQEEQIPPQQRRESGGPGLVVSERRPLSLLHDEMVAFARDSSPGKEELTALTRGLAAIQRVAEEIWPSARVVLFGSQASGLALPSSDVDLVVLGTSRPTSRPSKDFKSSERTRVAHKLGELAVKLRRAGFIRSYEVIHAKVPIVKAVLLPLDENDRPMQNGGLHLAMDISMGAETGLTGVAMVQRAVALLPPLRPLCLVVKALLKETGLNEVFTGGLSSYCLVNMMIAHLMCEGFDTKGILVSSSPEHACPTRASTGHLTRVIGSPDSEATAKRPRRGSCADPDAEDAAGVDAGVGANMGDDDNYPGEAEPDWVGSDGDSGRTSGKGGDSGLNDDGEDDDDMELYIESAASGEDPVHGATAPCTHPHDDDDGIAVDARPPHIGVNSPVVSEERHVAPSGVALNGIAEDKLAESVMREAVEAAAEAIAVINGGAGSSSVSAGLSTAQVAYLRSLGRQDFSAVDLGELLYGFFIRFGRQLDLSREAVNIRQGGITVRGSTCGRGHKTAVTLATDDPQQPGSDLGRNSFNIAAVLHQFTAAADKLADLARAAPERLLAGEGDDSEVAQWAAVQGDGSHRSVKALVTRYQQFKILNRILDLDLALCRSEKMAATRVANHKKKIGTAARGRGAAYKKARAIKGGYQPGSNQRVGPARTQGLGVKKPKIKKNPKKGPTGRGKAPVGGARTGGSSDGSTKRGRRGSIWRGRADGSRIKGGRKASESQQGQGGRGGWVMV
ncbi:hypothetical protein VaNZ11_016710 [Volvox africanus]|uniref:Poly(A) RNA polymerase mitochondrial-like central palm domain-containing protein n=1 Tax=Volvox africanus TaxID=51714 RepID=A0ABQ5SPP3_9CHLO|nr:hypothetical protein VaNZ11_016710 [Volvox africanus]